MCRPADHINEGALTFTRAQSLMCSTRISRSSRRRVTGRAPFMPFNGTGGVPAAQGDQTMRAALGRRHADREDIDLGDPRRDEAG